MMFSIRRSVCSRERTRPVTIMAMSPFFTRVPSCMSTSTCMSGSKRRNTSLATSTPARMPSSLMSRWLLPIASSGIQHKVVWSPSPISSANDRSMSLSTNSSTLNISRTFTVLRFHYLTISRFCDFTFPSKEPCHGNDERSTANAIAHHDVETQRVLRYHEE